MAKSRKKVFPKAPVRFHSGLEKTLGKNSNKTDYRANLMGIYYQPSKTVERDLVVLTQAEQDRLAKLRSTILGV